MKNRVEVNIYSLNYSYKHLVSDCFNNIARKQLKYHPPINQIVFKMYGLNRLEAK